MTTTTFFDTHRFVTNLSAKGFTLQQAEALAEEQANLLNTDLVTNGKLQKALAETKLEIIKWVVGMNLAPLAILTALVKLT